jgi:hypothetical protein
MNFDIKPATRTGIKPLIGIYSESGCGKTMSSLFIARGLVGPKGKIVMLDTESGRGSLYADVIPGGYEVMEMSESFSPSNYIAAIQAVEKSGASVLVIDSGSHEWEGLDGVTDMAMKISQGRAAKWNKEWDGVVQFGDWKQPKMEHQKFMLAMLQSPLPIIVCLRAKRKSHQTKGTKEMADAGIIEQRNIGKSMVLKDEFSSPIQAEDFIFEMMAHAEILQNHSIILTKCSHPSLRDCFPKDKTTPITIQHGELLAAWCASAGGAVTTPKVIDPPQDELKALKLELWAVLKPIRNPGEKTWDTANDWLWAEEILDAAKEPVERAPDLTVEKFREVIKAAKQKLEKGQLS